jgi:hypothetical protein
MDLSNLFNMSNDYKQRVVCNTIVQGGVVDTALVKDIPDPYQYETAIAHPLYNNDNFIIVEYYETREKALKGHHKWIKIMHELPDHLIDISDTHIANFLDLFKEDWRIFNKQTQK